MPDPSSPSSLCPFIALSLRPFVASLRPFVTSSPEPSSRRSRRAGVIGWGPLEPPGLTARPKGKAKSQKP